MGVLELPTCGATSSLPIRSIHSTQKPFSYSLLYTVSYIFVMHTFPFPCCKCTERSPNSSPKSFYYLRLISQYIFSGKTCEVYGSFSASHQNEKSYYFPYYLNWRDLCTVNKLLSTSRFLHTVKIDRCSSLETTIFFQTSHS